MYIETSISEIWNFTEKYDIGNQVTNKTSNVLMI